MLRLSEALVRHPEMDIRLLTDRVSHPLFAEKIDGAKLVPTGIRGDSIWEADRTVARFVRNLRPEIYHRPTGQLPFFSLPCRTVVSIADLNFRTLKMSLARRCYKELSYRWTVRQADRITCVSDFTRDEVIRHLNVPAKRLMVVHHGTSELQPPDYRLAASIAGPYWLTFGHQPHKNVEACLASLAGQRGGPLEKLVVVGQSKHIDTVLRAEVTRLGLGARVIFAGRVDEPSLRGLYERALGLLFLSRYEGFGLPVLEAMGCGCPVICSNACSLPEVAGDGALLFAPDDVAGIAKAMRAVAENLTLRGDLINRGTLRARTFTWERAARDTIEVYKSLLPSLNQA